MKINRILTQQTLKELSKSISKMADLLEPEKAYGIECKNIKVEKSTDAMDVYQMDIHIKISLIDSDLKDIEDVLERFK